MRVAKGGGFRLCSHMFLASGCQIIMDYLLQEDSVRILNSVVILGSVTFLRKVLTF